MQPVVRAQGQAAGSNQLALWSDTPRWVRSTAPLADERGLALPPLIAGPAGHALYLTDKQVRCPFESFGLWVNMLPTASGCKLRL